MERNLFDLTGRVAAVIGAGSGIGEAVALGCARHGARVACLDLNLEAVERVAGRGHADGLTLESAKLDDTFTFREKTTSVRWMWQHLVEEYARHNGHADLLREAIDGSAGL